MSLARTSRALPGLLGRLQQARAFASEPAHDGNKRVPQIPPFDYQPKPYVGPSFDETMALRKAHLSPGKLRRDLWSVQRPESFRAHRQRPVPSGAA